MLFVDLFSGEVALNLIKSLLASVSLYHKCAHVNLASVLNQYVPLSQVFILCFWQLTNS